MRVAYVVFLILLAPVAQAETPGFSFATLDGGFNRGQAIPVAIAKPRIDRVTWTLLGADAAARALDGYSTHRMFKADCSVQLKKTTARLCNYEQFLPDAISHHESALYAYEGAAWFTQYLAVRLLVKHHHPRLARFVPLIDFASTASFAINNLTLSVAVNGAASPQQLKSKPAQLNIVDQRGSFQAK